MNKLIASFVLLTSLSCANLHSDSVEISKLQGMGDIRYHLFDSERLGHPLHVYVRLPDSNEENAGKTFPAVYLLDGGINFPLLSSYYHYLRMDDEVPEMILVGISYGSDTFDGGNYRSSDFTAPAQDRAWWGRAPVFQEVLKSELIPMIESAYAADAGRRIIFGHSLGGQFVLYTSLTEPVLFWGHIASNPALHRNLAYFLDWDNDKAMPDATSKLFFSLAENEDSRFRQPAQDWVDHWKEREPKPWILKVRVLDDQSHLSAAPGAFRQGLLWLFDEQTK